MNDYNNNRHWSDQYLDQVKKVLGCGRANVSITSFRIDTQEAADLLIEADNKHDDVYVAVRLRKQQYVNKYPHDFTVRYEYTDGYKTEYQKIMEGFADTMFYGFVIGGSIARWIILDMDCFRKEAEKDYIIKEHKHNRDGRNSFLAFDIRSFKSNIVIMTSKGYFK